MSTSKHMSLDTNKIFKALFCIIQIPIVITLLLDLYLLCWLLFGVTNCVLADYQDGNSMVE